MGPVDSPQLTTRTADSLEILPTDHHWPGHALPLDEKRAFVFLSPAWIRSGFQLAYARALRWVATTFGAIGKRGDYRDEGFGESGVWRTCLVSARVQAGILE